MAFDLPALGVALLVVYPLAQIPVVVYLSRYVELRDGESAPNPSDGYAFHDGDSDRQPAAGTRRDRRAGPGRRPASPAGQRAGATCPSCGCANAAEFRFCHNCVARLG